MGMRRRVTSGHKIVTTLQACLTENKKNSKTKKQRRKQICVNLAGFPDEGQQQTKKTKKSIVNKFTITL